jgi:ABC-type multidrug transport system fused ATPase/permease subunit
MNKLIEIFKQYKIQLTWIYVFMLLTELFILSTPFLLGKSIDGLIVGNWYWIVLLGISYFLSNFFNYKRMVYDTKVYTTIYKNIALKFLKKDDVDVSTKIARTDMAHEIVNVLEGYVHYYIATIVTIIGSLIFIFSENWKVGVLVSVAIFFIISSVFILYKKIKQGIKISNNHYEKKAKSIESGYMSSESFFNRRRKIEICQSTIQGKNWFLINGIKYIFLILSIILLVTTTKNITIGSVITVYSYVNNFLIALLSAPVAIEMFLRISDVLKRLN